MKNLLILLVLFSWYGCSTAARQQKVFRSERLPKPDTTWVFTPESYTSNPGKVYPVVYLLHGWSGSYQQWDDIMDCQDYADKYGFILVCPDGLYDSWYLNSPVLPNSQYADFFFKELMPGINKDYRTDTKNIFITGLSMGGHGALYLFSLHPELFCSAGSLSGGVDLSDCADSYGIPRLLGLKNDESDKAILNKFSVEYNLESIQKSGKEIIFSCGTGDFFYDINNQLRISCDKLGIKATYVSAPGGHDYDFWRTHIKSHMIFFSERQVK